MAATRIHIEEFLSLSRQYPVLDVRSPGEYRHAHLPGAQSLPLFTDEERKIVGTTYKQTSREEAIKTGLGFFGPKMRPIVEFAEKLTSNNHSPLPATVLVYCWRGGMRSAAISWLLDMYGFRVYTLLGGYKQYRQQVLASLHKPYRFRILGGYTGTGKTEVLKALKEKGSPVIDLEDLAKHKGSAFGNIGMPEQPSQEMFENLLSHSLEAFGPALYAAESREELSVWLEDESQRIGQVNIPQAIWATMRRSPVFFLDIPFTERLQHIVEEYGKLDQDRIRNAIGRISKKLGPQHAKEAIEWLDAGNTTECFRILLKYYDKYYGKALHNREDLPALLHVLTGTTVSPQNAQILLRHLSVQASV